MAYYLAVERTLDSFEAINIKKTHLGRNLFLNDTYECTLEEIDRFTTQYVSIEQLIHELYCDKSIAWPSSSIATVCVCDTKISIERDMIFKESKKYLNNPSLVSEYLINELSSCNVDFARELLERVEDSKTKEILETLIQMMEEKIDNDIPLDMTSIMYVVEMLVHNTNEPTLYEYSKIHNAVLAIVKYENKLNENTQSYQRRRKNTSN